MSSIRLIDRTFDILEAFVTSNKEDIRLTELAKLTGLNKATVNRIASALVNRGYLRQRKKRGKYTLGVKFLDYSWSIKKRSKIRDIAMPHLLRLSQLLGESVILSILSELNEHVVLQNETIHTRQFLRIVPDEGTQSKFGLYSTSAGKIFLSTLTESELESYLNSVELKSFTANTITDISQLKAHLMVVAKEGIGFDDEESIVGARAVSAGIKDDTGKIVAAVVVLGPTIRLTLMRITDILHDIKNCAFDISRDLGFKE